MYSIKFNVAVVSPLRDWRVFNQAPKLMLYFGQLPGISSNENTLAGSGCGIFIKTFPGMVGFNLYWKLHLLIHN